MNRRRFVKKIGLGAGACVAAVAGLWAGKAERRSRPRMTTATEVAMGGEADAWREGAALERAELDTETGVIYFNICRVYTSGQFVGC